MPQLMAKLPYMGLIGDKKIVRLCISIKERARKRKMISLEKNEKIVETRELTIYRNTLIYEDSVIQLENISRISVSPIEKRKIPLWSIICAILGVLALGTEAGMGMLLLAIGGGYFCYILYQNSQLGHYLTLELNSGYNIYFTGKNIEFLKRITKVLAECMNDKNNSYTIHMEQATIDNIQIGDKNKML